jgi:hypothetical protein
VNAFYPDGRITLAQVGSTLGIASVLVEGASILTGCAEQHIGIETGLGAALIVLGLPILPTETKFGGSTWGTSLASKYLSELLPYELPVRVRPKSLGGITELS